MFKEKVMRATVGVATSALVATMLVMGGGSAASADLLPGVSPIEQRNDAMVTADGLPTVQIDSGIVWAQAMNGNVVYAGGSFSQTRPAGAAPGTNLTARSNLLAYDVTNGQLLPFAPQINGTVKSLAVSPDGRTLYVGGSFNKVGTTTRFNVAAFDTATGELSATFKPAIGGSYVNAIVATSSAVYFGGLIGAAGGQPRTNFAAANVAGQVLGWAPTSDLQVDSMVLAPDGGRLIAAGRFARINGVTQRGLAALDMNNGALLPWDITSIVRNGRNDGTGNSGKAGIWALTADDTNVYGTGWVYADVNTGNLEGLFAAESATGDEVWIADCHGDHYGVFSDGTNVYSTGHEHECTTAGGLPQGSGTMRNATVYTAAAKGTLTRSPFVNNIYADWSGHPAPAAVNWFPDWFTGTASGMGQAAWTVTGNDEYVVFGGEFIGVNNQTQQGLVRFARSPQSGARQGPMVSGAAWTPTGRSLLGGTADVVVPANWDRDDLNLTYQLIEEGTTQPVATTQMSSTFWNKPDVRLRAQGLAPGSSHTYRVKAVDGNGNSALSAPVAVTVTSEIPSAYANTVLAAEPQMYWRFNQPDPKLDWAGSTSLTTRSGYSANSDSAISGESGSAAFNGGSSGYAVTSKSVAASSEYSLEFWFKAAPGSSGKLMGYGNSNNASSSSYDRHVYLTSKGRLYYGNYPGEVKTVSTPSGTSYANNAWHHVVATQGSDGMALYVDGVLAASDPATSGAQAYAGYWRIGGDNLSGWPDAPSNAYVTARMDEVAVYARVLSPQEVSQHFAIGTGMQPPAAAFTVDGTGFDRAFDASSTTSTGGTPTYGWNFGDGTPDATGVTAQHTYAEPGTYTVTLTVTDTVGISDVATQVVVIAEPHVAPMAAIVHSANGLTATFDASGSTATGGATVTGFAWTFGDGHTSTEAAPTHRYDLPGEYAVSLIVTDSLGSASVAATTQVVISHAAPQAEFDVDGIGLIAQVDASASTASDDATLTYEWNWGDGTAVASGVEAEHEYADAGTYVITLTVVDSLGSTATTTREITVSGNLVEDDFGRTVQSGWGTADIGGAWSGALGLSVGDGVGKLTVNKSQTRRATLPGVAVEDFDARVSLSMDKIANGGGLHMNVIGRLTDAGDYRIKLRTSASGVVSVNIAQTLASAETLLAARNLSGVTLSGGDVLNVRFKAASQGAATSLSAKVWVAGTSEPSDWLVSAVSSTPALQEPGALSIASYGTGTISNGPIVVSVDDLVVQGAQIPAHVAPVADIVAQASGLSVAFASSGSQVHDGATLLGFMWDFGDGSTSTEANPTHEYAAAGTYAATLTVTDSFGASSDPVSTSVTVEHGAPVAEFAATPNARTVAVDATASYALDSAEIAAYSWDWGDGTVSEGAIAEHTFDADGAVTITLTVTDTLGASSTATRTVALTSAQFLVRDEFARDVASGWGTAEQGGTWSGSNGLAVVGGQGNIVVNKSQTRAVSMSDVSITDSDTTFTVSLDQIADGGGVHINYGMHASDAGAYRAKLRVSATGTINVGIARLLGTSEALIANRLMPDFALTAGAELNVRVQTVTAGGATTIQVRTWPVGAEEPTTWNVTATDTEAALQGAGGLSLSTYASGTVTNGPVTLRVDHFAVK